MKRSTHLTSFLSIVSAGLLLLSTSAYAQHGGGHSGGGGGGHAGGGGGFHGGGGPVGGYHGGGFGGGYHGGGFGGGYHGGFHGGAGPGAYSGRGSMGGMRGAHPGQGSAQAGHPWSWEGHSSRNTSPGWHQFDSGNRGGMGSTAGRSAPGHSGESPMARASVPSRGVADGHWHSFGSGTRANSPGAVSNIHLTTTSRSTVVSTNTAWHGNYWGWHGGWGWHGWYGGWGWGWPDWNWGFGWGCCGWGWGWGFGWGWWGAGWSAWAPFWAWPPYYYYPWLDNSSTYGDASPAPYVLDPYPA